MKKNVTYTLFTIILWGIYVFLISILIWGLNKGFDFTDEGYSMLSYSTTQEDVIKNRPFFFILSKLLNFANPGILFWRVLRLVLLVFSAFVFSSAFIKWIRFTLNINPTFSLIYFFPTIGIITLMNYSIGYQGLSYNALTLIIVQLASGLFLYYTSINSDNHRCRLKKNIIAFTIGFLFYVLFLVKFPSAIILLIAFSVLFFICEVFEKKQPIIQFIIVTLIVFTGFLFAASLTTSIYNSPFIILKNLIYSSKLIPNHDLRYLFEKYINTILYNFLKEIYTRHPVVIISPIVLLLLFRNSFYKLFILFFAGTFLYMVWDVIVFKYYKSGMDHIYSASGLYRMFMLFLLVFISLILIDKHTREIILFKIKNIKTLFIGAILLFIIPFICSIGTDSDLSIHITQFIFSWIILFILFSFILFSEIDYSDILLKFFIISLMINISSQIISGFVFSPYKLKPLTEQKYSVSKLAKGKTILFDYETSRFLQGITKHNKLINGNPIITLYSFPGLTYLLGSSSPGAPWYIDSGYKDYTKTNCYFLHSSNMKNIKNTILLVENDYPIPQEFIDCLSEKGIFFKESYILIDSVQKPYEKGKILLYVPKH